MAYTPNTWATGDLITATKLNHIESGVQEVSNAYTPTTWVTGDAITATKLNNIEQGIANAGGNPYEYLGLTFATIEVTGNTPPEDSDPIANIRASCYIDGDDMNFASVSQQLTQLVVPVMSGHTTTVDLAANNFSYMPDVWNADAETTGTGGVSVSSDSGITVTGDGTISINWIWS